MTAAEAIERTAPWRRHDVGVLLAAYPDGVPAEEYDLLVYVLSETCSHRGAAYLLNDCGFRDYIGAYHDVLGIAGRPEQYAEASKPVLAKLIAHGYDSDAD